MHVRDRIKKAAEIMKQIWGIGKKKDYKEQELENVAF